MASADKALGLLLELGNPGVRRTRAEHLEHALRTALALTDGDAAVVLPPWGRRPERVVMHGGSPTTAQLPVPPQGSPIVRTLTEDAQPILIADLAEDGRIHATDGCPGVEAGPVLFVALRQRDPVPGYLAIYRRRGRARFNLADTRSMVMLAASLGTTLDALRIASGTEKLALTDDLTQIYNARFLKTALRRELRRAGRFGQELSLLVVGLDQLESVRVQHGELRANVLMKEAATLLAQQVRSFDLIARGSDDQFMVVLPQTGRDGALLVAERMRAAVEANAFSSAEAGDVTVSIGVSAFPRQGADASALTAAAARALTRARETGANRVESLHVRAA